MSDSLSLSNVKLSVYLFVLLCCSVRALEQDDVPCTFTSGEDYWDLSPLKNSPNGWPASDASYTYSLNFCAEVTSSTECTAVQGGFCQFRTTTNAFEHSLSSWTLAGSAPVLWEPLNGDPTQGLAIVFSNGDVCAYNGKGYTRYVYLNLICDPTAGKGGSYTVTVSSNPPCTYTVPFRTALACPGPIPKAVTGLSGGWIFLIIFIVFIPVYCVFGCIYNRKRKGTTGMVESIPNVEFWKGLPSLVKDGCSFVYQKTRQLLCKGASYEPLK